MGNKRRRGRARHDKYVWRDEHARYYRGIRICPRCGAANTLDPTEPWPVVLYCAACGVHVDGSYQARGESYLAAWRRIRADWSWPTRPARRYARRKGQHGRLIVEELRWNGRKYVRERIVG